MECTHLEDVTLSDPWANLPDDVDKTQHLWKCSNSDCQSQLSPWICLFCGLVSCGRYVKGHAKAHWEEHPKHSVCLELHSMAVFCYTCDDFVLNDSPSESIKKLRECLAADTKLDVSLEENDVDEKVKEEQNSGLQERLHSTPKHNHLNSEEQENRRSPRLSAKKKKQEVELTKKRKSDNGSPGISKKRLKQKLGVVGIRNLGNTCFMNAVLQSLSNIQEFCGYFQELPELNNVSFRNGKRAYATRYCIDVDVGLMTEELRKILIGLWKKDTKGAISPESLFQVIWKVVPRFRGYQQQDAHEFLRYMLDRLHTELALLLLPEQHSPTSHTIVSSVFGGTLMSEVKCLSCGTISRKHDPFLDLSLDVPNQFVTRSHKSRENDDKQQKQPPVCRIADCLQSFTDVEELAETELYYCSNCKCRQRSTKKFWIRRLPNVLCLHVKRFRWQNYFRQKLDVMVHFPITALDMSEYILSNCLATRRSRTGPGENIYDLAAVIVHHGSGAGSGHYTAFAIHNGTWYHFNDSTVKVTDEDSVKKSKAYILFYIRREFRLPKLSHS